MNSQIQTIVLFSCPAIFGGAALYTRLLADHLFSRLEFKYPEYYEAIGRPYHGLNLRRSGIAEDMLIRFVYLGIPSKFPHDAELRGMVRRLRIAGLAFGLPSFIIFAIFMFVR